MLMVLKSGGHQLRLVVYPIILEGFIHPRWLFGISEPSTVFRSIFEFSEMLYKKDEKRQGAVAASSVQKRATRRGATIFGFLGFVVRIYADQKITCDLSWRLPTTVDPIPRKKMP